MPEIVIQIIQVCVIPLLGILTKYLVDYLTAKRNEINSKTDNETAQKYTNMIYEAAQKEAFNRTMNAIMTILSDDAKEYITEATGDLNTYLTQLIEAEVNKRK